MSHIYTDYLFTLYINCKPVSLEILLEQTGATGKVNLASDETPECILKTMEDSGLIKMILMDGIQYIGLTERGKEVSVFVADVVTAIMLSEWEQRISRENVLLKSA